MLYLKCSHIFNKNVEYTDTIFKGHYILLHDFIKIIYIRNFSLCLICWYIYMQPRLLHPQVIKDDKLSTLSGLQNTVQDFKVCWE